MTTAATLPAVLMDGSHEMTMADTCSQHFSETEVRTNPDEMDLRDSTSLVMFEVHKI